MLTQIQFKGRNLKKKQAKTVPPHIMKIYVSSLPFPNFCLLKSFWSVLPSEAWNQGQTLSLDNSRSEKSEKEKL